MFRFMNVLVKKNHSTTTYSKKIVDTTDEFVPNTIIVCYDLKQQQEQKQQEKTSLANIQFSFHFVSFEMSYALYFRSTSSVPLLVWI